MWVEEGERIIAKYVMYVQDCALKVPFKPGYKNCFRRGRPKCKPCD